MAFPCKIEQTRRSGATRAQVFCRSSIVARELIIRRAGKLPELRVYSEEQNKNSGDVPACNREHHHSLVLELGKTRLASLYHFRAVSKMVISLSPQSNSVQGALELGQCYKPLPQVLPKSVGSISCQKEKNVQAVSSVKATKDLSLEQPQWSQV